MYRYISSAFILCLLMPTALYAHHTSPTPSAKSVSFDGITSGTMIHSPTASTLGQNRLQAGFAFEYVRYNSIPAANAHRLHHQGRDVHGKNHEQAYDMNFGYGILKDLDVYGAAPVVSKNSIEIHDHENLGAKERATGFGDLRFSTNYKFWKKYVEASVITGIKFPTGKTTAKRRSGDKFAPELQPGTGSWDGQFGVAVSRSFKKRFSAAASFEYFLNGEGAQGHKAGDIFRSSIGGSYAVRNLGSSPNVNVILEFNNEWALKDHSREENRVFDSGGTTLSLSPGIIVSLTRNISLFWSCPIPIYQNLGGEHEEKKFEMVAGSSFIF